MRTSQSGRQIPTSMTYRPLLRIPNKTGRQNLNPTEQVLLGIVFIVVVACLLMVMCVGLVLPEHWLNETHVSYKTNYPKPTKLRLTMSTSAATTTTLSTITTTTPAPDSDSHRKFSDICMCYEHVNEPNCDATVSTLSREDRTIKCDKSYEHPYLVSLSLPAYIDDLEEREFACTGTILSKHWVLTGGDCVQDDYEINYLRLRAGSACWSHEGTEHRILLYQKYKTSGPVLVKVAPNFEFSNHVQAATLFHGQRSLSPVTSATTGWARHASLKYSKYETLKWSPKKCPTCTPAKIIFHANCALITGRPLVNIPNRNVLGLLSEDCVGEGEDEDEKIFVSVHDTQILAWITKVLNSEGDNLTHSTSTACVSEGCTQTAGITSAATSDETVSASTFSCPETSSITTLIVSSTTLDASTQVLDDINTDMGTTSKTTEEYNNATSTTHTTITTTTEETTDESSNAASTARTTITAKTEETTDESSNAASTARTTITAKTEETTDESSNAASTTHTTITRETTDQPTNAASTTHTTTREETEGATVSPKSSSDIQTASQTSELVEPIPDPKFWERNKLRLI